MAEVRDQILAPFVAQGVRASVGAGGGRWRRRAVRLPGPQGGRAPALQRAVAREGQDDPRRGRCRYVAQRRQARDVDSDGSAEGGRPRRAARGRGRGAAPAGRGRRGDDVQRGGGAVPGARAGRIGRPRHGGRHRTSAGALVTTGERDARERRELRLRRGPFRHPPAGATASGHRLGQSAAGHLAGGGAEPDARGVAATSGSAPTTRRGSAVSREN